MEKDSVVAFIDVLGFNKEAYRHRRCALVAAVAAKTEAPFVVGANLVQATSWLARIVGAMESTATVTSASSRLRGQFNIDLKQQTKKSGILEEGVAHFDGLLAW